VSEAAGLFPGGVRQFGFVVPDLDVAIASWAALGIGPWFVTRDVKMSDCRYRGALAEPTLSIALANVGDVQIELIAQLDDTPSIYKEFLDATGGGFNQVAYWVDDVEAVRDAAIAAGWTEVWSGDPGVRFSYLEHPDAPVTIVELTANSELTRGSNDAIREAARTWTVDQPAVSVDMSMSQLSVEEAVRDHPGN
jgi:hypothetical protein